MNRTAKTIKDAKFVRQATGSSGVETTAERAVAALAAKGIPSLICGGLAVQEYGYPRMTVDVDLIVPSVGVAYAVLALSGFKPSRETPGKGGLMTDRENKVTLDLLPGGQSIGGPVEFPTPQAVSRKPVLVRLETLVSLKLSSALNAPLHRSKDKTDVIELVTRRKMPRDLDVDPKVKEAYQTLWDALQAEKS